MNRVKQTRGAIICAIVGLAAGWVIHGGSKRVDPTPAGPAAKSDRHSGKHPAPAGVAAAVGPIAGLDNAGHRMKAAYAMAMRIPIDRIREYLDGGYFATSDPSVEEFFKCVDHLPDGWVRSVITEQSWLLARGDPDACLALAPEDLGMEPGSLDKLRQNTITNLTNHHPLTSDQILATASPILENEASLSDHERQAITGKIAHALAARDGDKDGPGQTIYRTTHSGSWPKAAFNRC
jgi:hypothetical protein